MCKLLLDGLIINPKKTKRSLVPDADLRRSLVD